MQLLDASDRRVTRAEWLWVATASLLLMLLFSVPYVVGMLHSTPELMFGGHLFAMDDMHSYIAKMRYGAAHPGWLFKLVYTTEPHDGGFVFAQYLALGKLAAWLSGEGARVSARTLNLAFHAARVLWGLALLAAMYRFVADFLGRPPMRRLAWALIALAGGLGWVPLLFGSETMPVSLYSPEAFTILLLFGLPHLALSRALLLGGWLCAFRALDGGTRWFYILGAALAWTGMSVMVPIFGAVLGVLIAAWLLMLLITRRRVPWLEFTTAGVAGAGPAALIVYNALLFTRNPGFAAWFGQKLLASPPSVDYLLAYGVLLALGGIAVLYVIRAGELRRLLSAPRTALLLVWPLVAAALVHLPINVQRRLLEGVIVPLGILAVMGAAQFVGARKRGSGLRRGLVGVLLILLIPPTAVLLSGAVGMASSSAGPVFHPADELAALGWLRDHAPTDSAVLSTWSTGNLLPAHAGVRVYVGHGPETIDAKAKEQQALAFLHGGMTDAERRALLDSAGIDYVWVGPSERPDVCSANCFDPVALGLTPVFEQGPYMIYAVGAP